MDPVRQLVEADAHRAAENPRGDRNSREGGLMDCVVGLAELLACKGRL